MSLLSLNRNDTIVIRDTAFSFMKYNIRIVRNNRMFRVVLQFQIIENLFKRDVTSLWFRARISFIDSENLSDAVSSQLSMNNKTAVINARITVNVSSMHYISQYSALWLDRCMSIKRRTSLAIYGFVDIHTDIYCEVISKLTLKVCMKVYFYIVSKIVW